MDSRRIIKELEAAGWVKVRVQGSHHHFRKEGENLLVTVPHPRKDIPIGTVRNIEKASNLKLL